MLTTGTVYRWFVEQFYGGKSAEADFETANRDVLCSPPGANGTVLLPYFEGSGAPYWNPKDTGIFYGLKLSTKRSDLARAVIEGLVLGMEENVSLFRETLGTISHICVAGGMTEFNAYNQLQADIYGSEVVLYANRESTSLGAWISAAVACGLYDSYDAAFGEVQPQGSEKCFLPDKEMNQFYRTLNRTRQRLYQAMQAVAGES